MLNSIAKNNHTPYTKLLATLIAFIFSFESAGYCLPRTRVRVPMGTSYRRVEETQETGASLLPERNGYREEGKITRRLVIEWLAKGAVGVVIAPSYVSEEENVWMKLAETFSQHHLELTELEKRVIMLQGISKSNAPLVMFENTFYRIKRTVESSRNNPGAEPISVQEAKTRLAAIVDKFERIISFLQKEQINNPKVLRLKELMEQPFSFQADLRIRALHISVSLGTGMYNKPPEALARDMKAIFQTDPEGLQKAVAEICRDLLRNNVPPDVMCMYNLAIDTGLVEAEATPSIVHITMRQLFDAINHLPRNVRQRLRLESETREVMEKLKQEREVIAIISQPALEALAVLISARARNRIMELRLEWGEKGVLNAAILWKQDGNQNHLFLTQRQLNTIIGLVPQVTWPRTGSVTRIIFKKQAKPASIINRIKEAVSNSYDLTGSLNDVALCIKNKKRIDEGI